MKGKPIPLGGERVVGRLGHGGTENNEYVPRLIEGVLVGKRVIGVSAGSYHTVVWPPDHSRFFISTHSNNAER